MTSAHLSAKQPQLTIALHQHIPTPADLETSLQRIQTVAEQASARGAQLLLVPEASVTGYNIPLSNAQAIALERDGTICDRLKSCARQYDIALAFGYIERQGDDLFNAVQVIDATGTSLSHYQKTHLWGDLDRQLFSAGNKFAPVFNLHGWKIGLLICYDIEFPETVRHLALAGCDLVLAPTALMRPWTFVADHVTRVRAAENQVYLAYANYCGSENDIDYVGHSCIAGPDGEILARASTEPALLVETLSLEAISTIRQSVPYHQDRRPELYSS